MKQFSFLCAILFAVTLTSLADISRGPFDDLRELYKKGEIQSARQHVLAAVSASVKTHRNSNPKESDRLARRHLDALSSAASFLGLAFDEETKLADKKMVKSTQLIDSASRILVLIEDANKRVHSLQKGTIEPLLQRQIDALESRRNTLKEALERYSTGGLIR